jgi:hypothetical protein
MADHQQEIDRKLKAALLRERLSEFRPRHFWVMAAIVAFLGCIAVAASTMPNGTGRLVRYEYGIAESSLIPASKRLPPTQVAVRLENGSRIAVVLPAGQLYLHGARVKVGLYAYNSDGNALRGRFEGYEERGAGSAG